MTDDIGKKAEAKIAEWLNHPELGQSFDRIPDQMTGFFGSKNICDFTYFKSPELFYIESKATWDDRFEFTMITDYQRENLIKKSNIYMCYGVVMVLFASYKRAFILDIRDIQSMMDQHKMSLNIKKIDKWPIPFIEVKTIANNRKHLLDYTGEFDVPHRWNNLQEVK